MSSPSGFLMFSRGRQRVHWKKWVNFSFYLFYQWNSIIDNWQGSKYAPAVFYNINTSESLGTELIKINASSVIFWRKPPCQALRVNLEYFKSSYYRIIWWLMVVYEMFDDNRIVIDKANIEKWQARDTFLFLT